MSHVAPGPYSAIQRVAEQAALTAGRHFRTFSGKTDVAATKDGSQDLVTVVDRRCQDLIEESIKTSFPTHSILGEENVPSGSEASAAALQSYLSSEWLWIIDPIDGTCNFVHGIPFSVVSIGVAHKGEVVVGVIYDPYRDELFSAVRGVGAYCNGEQLKTSKDTQLSQAVVAFGTHHTPEMAAAMLKGVNALAPVTRSVRSFGSAALHLAWVARGWLTAFYELDLSSWDIAAGALLVQEAGGSIADVRGAPFTLNTRDMFATNGANDIHNGILQTLKAAGANSA